MAVIRLTTTETETPRLGSVSGAQMPPLRNPAHRLLIGHQARTLADRGPGTRLWPTPHVLYSFRRDLPPLLPSAAKCRAGFIPPDHETPGLRFGEEPGTRHAINKITRPSQSQTSGMCIRIGIYITDRETDSCIQSIAFGCAQSDSVIVFFYVIIFTTHLNMCLNA
jgi:hypothetical protein